MNSRRKRSILELHEIETKNTNNNCALTREYDLKLMRLRQDLLNKLFDELTDYLKHSNKPKNMQTTLRPNFQVLIFLSMTMLKLIQKMIQ